MLVVGGMIVTKNLMTFFTELHFLQTLFANRRAVFATFLQLRHLNFPSGAW
jgi:hypothetical protein